MPPPARRPSHAQGVSLPAFLLYRGPLEGAFPPTCLPVLGAATCPVSDAHAPFLSPFLSLFLSLFCVRGATCRWPHWSALSARWHCSACSPTSCGRYEFLAVIKASGQEGGHPSACGRTPHATGGGGSFRVCTGYKLSRSALYLTSSNLYSLSFSSTSPSPLPPGRPYWRCRRTWPPAQRHTCSGSCSRH